MGVDGGVGVGGPHGSRAQVYHGRHWAAVFYRGSGNFEPFIVSDL